MKKTPIIVAITVILLLVLAFFVVLRPDKTPPPKSLPTDGSGVMRVQTYGRATFGIVTRGYGEVTVNLRDEEKAIGKIRFFKVGNDIEFGYSDQWDGGGTITVPEGTEIELDLSDNQDLFVDGKRQFHPGSYTLITTSNTTVTITDTGVVVSNAETDGGGGDLGTTGDTGGDGSAGGEGEGEGEGEEEPQTTQYDPSQESSDPESDDDPVTTEYVTENNEQCSIDLKQEVRNTCCQNLFADEPHSACAYEGYWLFNYNTRLCYYHCFSPCNAGTQEEQNLCCSQEHQFDSTPGCIGNWEYDNSLNECGYACLTQEELDAYFGEEEDEPTDAISAACKTHSNPDECCDFNLKNELSIGPRPGFPDCIGRYAFYEDINKCEFRCSSHGEMLDILRQLEGQ